MGRLYNEPWEQCDIRAFADGIKGNGVISGLAVTEKGTPDMGVAVATGSCFIGSTTYTEASTFNLSIDNGHATHDRKDLIIYDSSAGDPAVVKGTAATPPVPPAVPSGDILLAVVLVEAAESTSIVNSDITEGRVLIRPYRSNNEVRDAVEAADNSNTFNDADHTKLNGCDTGSTNDQTATEIRVLVEAATNSNVFTDADHNKLNGLAAKPIRVVVVKCIRDARALTTGDGKAHFTVPIELDGMNLVSVGGHVYTVSSSGLPNFQIHNLTDAVNMLSTSITIDATEKDSATAATAAVIDTSHDNVSTGDEIRFDCDGAGTGTKGMEIRMGFQEP